MKEKQEKKREAETRESMVFSKESLMGIESSENIKASLTVVHVRKKMPRGDASWRAYGVKPASDRC